MNKSTNKEKLSEYSFLTNEAIGEDLFKNKSQQKIANVICEKIINEPDFKVIGIDGEWGSGKSNLVKIIEKDLIDTHTFFIYDVWGHQEDEQRRAILVELTEFIKSEKGLLKSSQQNWNFKLKQLLANSKETTTINQPYLSIGFIFSLLSIIYVPTVNVFKDSLTEYFEIDNLLGKLILVTFPLSILLAIYLYNYFKHLFFENKGVFKSLKTAAEETFQVYTNKQKEETKIETISDTQPTVRDFRNWMDDIDQDLNKKIILVFDNFDRLPKKHILNIWSSIHIFFAEKKYDNIKIILPFDRKHIQNAFEELNAKNDNTFGDDYVNKTFDIVFRVTLPIMSDWKKFFISNWKTAFKEDTSEELLAVIQIYEFLNRRITPREIISFINEILTIKLIDENFKERYIAIFVLAKELILQNPLQAITNLVYLKGLQSIYENDSAFTKQLTAIIYHINVDDALELIYTQELKKSLNSNNVEVFNTICKEDFSDSIFTSTIMQLSVYDNPIRTLAKIEDDSKISLFHQNQAWNTIYHRVINNSKVIENLKIDDWELILISKNSDNFYLKRQLKIYAQIAQKLNVIDYIKLIDILFNKLSIERVQPLLTMIEIVAADFLAIVEDKGNNYHQYNITINDEIIDKHLSEMSIDNLILLNNVTILNKNFSLPKYKTYLIEQFKLYIDHNKLNIVGEILLKLKEIEKKDEALKDILDESRIYSCYINNALADSPLRTEMIAMRIAKGKKFNASYANAFEAILNEGNSDKALEVKSTILNYIDLHSLLMLSEFFNDKPLYESVIKSLLEDYDQEEFNSLEVLLHYSSLKANINDDNQLLLKKMNQSSLDLSAVAISLVDKEFISDCFKMDDLSISKSFRAVFNDSFKKLSAEEYDVIFTDKASNYFHFLGNIELTSFTQLSLDKFEEHLHIALKKSSVPEFFWTILNIFESNNASLSVINTLKNIRDNFLNSSQTINLSSAVIIIPYLFKYNLMTNKKDIFRTILKNAFLSDNLYIEILIKNIESLKVIYQNSTPIDREGFRNSLNEKRLKSKNIEEIAKKIGIRKT